MYNSGNQCILQSQHAVKHTIQAVLNQLERPKTHTPTPNSHATSQNLTCIVENGCKLYLLNGQSPPKCKLIKEESQVS